MRATVNFLVKLRNYVTWGEIDAETFKELISKRGFRHIPIVDNKRLVGIVSVRDISKAFYAEKEIMAEMKTKFAMITSHELKTPCTIIKLCVDSMRELELKEPTPEGRRIMSIIEENTERLEKIVASLSKLYIGAFDFAKSLKPSSIEAIVQSTVKDITPFLNKRKQALIIEIENNIPEVMMQENGIKQALVNLLLNAIRFTPDRGRIVIRAKNKGNNIEVEIEDNGIGIPKNRLKSIFESFYEVKDVEGHSSGGIEFNSSGLGLGLTIVKNILDVHQGKIWVESEVDKFSKFTFSLPKKTKETN